jgi:hypothetical protein
VPGISISPDAILEWFRALSAGWLIVIAISPLVMGATAGWFVRGWVVDRERSADRKDLVEEHTANRGRVKVDSATISILSALSAQAGELFDEGCAVKPDEIEKWNTNLLTWHANASEAITAISEIEAVLFDEVRGGPLIAHYRDDQVHNRVLNGLLGHQENLRKIIKRYS